MTKPIMIKGQMIGEGLPKICVPLTGKTEPALLKEAADAKAAGADLVEWRADFYENLTKEEQLLETLKGIADVLEEIPLLFTIRTKAEGGQAEIEKTVYAQTNLAAAKSGYADLADIEVYALGDAVLIKELQRTGVKVIASSHDFEKTDDRETLLKRFQEMDASGADMLKMAVMSKTFDDAAAIMQVTNTMVHEYTEKPVISMAMGNEGSISRIAGENFGSAITFATVGAPSAPGQFPIGELRVMMQALHEKNQQ